MKNTLLPIALFILVFINVGWHEPTETVVAKGQQPELSVDNNGRIRLVFGRSDSIFCTTSVNGGTTFSTPVFIGYIKDMHLGATRGPQIASSSRYSIITAMDKTGNIHFFELNALKGQWEYKGLINDIPGSAPEGLMSIAADRNDHFYAVWLDIRQNKRNNICFSTLTAKTGTWEKNKIVYRSPDEHVCECCKPTIAVNNKKVAIMYRNWLNGSRDLYLTTSNDEGNTFTPAQKLGYGTWKLNGCPMDGGGLQVDNKGVVYTTWQREGTIYYCIPQENEVPLLKGRSCSLAINESKSNKIIVNMQDAGQVKLVDPATKKETVVGKGIFLKSILLPNGQTFCAWEEDKNIVFRKME